jgi:hypothetical protein
MTDVSDESVEQVLVMFKCHLDVGFTDTEANVLRTYHTEHLPRAMEIAQHLRNTGEDRYVWTVPAWLLYRHLRQVDAAGRRRVEAAIAAGDIAWHALPFTWYTELLDRSSIAASLGFSRWLDEAFGKHTTAARMTDVPGHTRGLVGPLADAGITFLDIGVNPGCKAPAVPFVPAVGLPESTADEPDPDQVKWNDAEPVHADQGTPAAERRRLAIEGINSPQTHLFRWREDSGKEVTVLYHRSSYGGTARIPGLPLAVSMRVHGDNLGPHSLESIRHAYSTLRRKFPNAQVRAADLTTIGDAVTATPSELPVETREIGDTWIYGTGSDPAKTAGLREVLRLRSSWLAAGELAEGSPTDLDLLEQLIPAPEHNWGLSTSVHLRCWTGYDTAELAEARGSDDRFRRNDEEWVVKRDRPRRAVEVLPSPLRDRAAERLEALRQPAPDPVVPGETGGSLDNGVLRVEVSSATGAVTSLTDLRTGRQWAGPAGLALFSYVGYDPADYERFSRTYNYSAFTANDFGKPGLGDYDVQHVEWTPGGASTRRPTDDTLHVELVAPAGRRPGDERVTAWPGRVVLGYRLAEASPTLDLSCWVVGKPANRRPEALWLSFHLAADDPGGWRLDKVGQQVDPHDVVEDGARRLHGIGSGLAYADDSGSCTLESLDAHLVSPGEKGLLRFDNDQLDTSAGMHFALYNNLWGTAFPQWYDADMFFRFRLTVPEATPEGER